MKSLLDYRKRERGVKGKREGQKGKRDEVVPSWKIKDFEMSLRIRIFWEMN